MKNRDEILLETSFCVDAEIKSDIPSIKARISKMSGTKILYEGLTLKFGILGMNKRENEKLLELSDKYICLRFFNEKNSKVIYKENLSLLITLLAFLDEYYEVQLGSIYKYILEGIGGEIGRITKNQEGIIERLDGRIDSLNESNCMLANEVIESSKAKRLAYEELQFYKSFCRDLIMHMISKEKEHPNMTDNVLVSLGIDKTAVERVKSRLEIEK